MSTQELTIVAIISAKEGQRDFVRAEMLKVIEPTRAEEGCLQYDLHEDNITPNTFLFYERWSSQAAWEAHMQQPHLTNFSAAIGDAVEKPQILQLTKTPA